LEVDVAQSESLGVANIIAKTYKLFKEIEDASESGGGGMGKTTDFRICYTFAQLQKLLLNDIG
jgi:hypothetical protein